MVLTRRDASFHFPGLGTKACRLLTFISAPRPNSSPRNTMHSHPALSMPSPNQQPLAPVGHISLMIDTFIANSNVEEYVLYHLLKTYSSHKHLPRSLRAVVRGLLVTGPPNTTSAFQKVAKQRLRRHRVTDKSLLPSPTSLFVLQDPYSSSSSSLSSSSSSLPSTISDDSLDPHFTPQVFDIIARARALFGAGLGLQSLPLLTLLIRGTQNLRWSEDGTFVDSMAILDSDIAQAIQSSCEQISSSNLDDMTVDEGKQVVKDLTTALKQCEAEVEEWGGEFPFQRGLANVEWLVQSDLWQQMQGA